MSGWAIIDDREAAPEPTPVSAERAHLLGIRRAPFGRRVAATIIDVLPILAFIAPLPFVATSLVGPDGRIDVLLLIAGSVCALLLLLYAILQLASHGRRGQTLGKQATRLRTLRATTLRPIGFGRALLRVCVFGLSGVLPGVGPLLLALSALWDPQRRGRAWHDHVVDTWLIDMLEVDPTDPVAFDAARARARVQSVALGAAPEGASVAASPLISRVPLAKRVPPSDPQPERLRPEDQAGETVGRGHDPSRPEIEAASPPTLTLDDGTAIVVAGLTLLGRQPAAAPGEIAHLIPIADGSKSVSKTHIALDSDAHGLIVTDRGSANGTTIVRGAASSRATPRVPLRVRPGDEIHIGERTLTVG
ncbi:RDD family protein [Microbacterium karelineae]|uniref:RDD family protein n=1 Tax=Microbacterium karelineae TaxID=2654283 RepID=UPI0012EAF117|nr:RDD family protein [Microbacterium karelineae]